MTNERLNNSYLQPLTVAAREIFPDIRTISGCPTRPEVNIGGRRTLLVCSPNYLGLADHPAVIGAFQRATDPIRYRHGRLGPHLRIYGGASEGRRGPG